MDLKEEKIVGSSETVGYSGTVDWEALRIKRINFGLICLGVLAIFFAIMYFTAKNNDSVPIAALVVSSTTSSTSVVTSTEPITMNTLFDLRNYIFGEVNRSFAEWKQNGYDQDLEAIDKVLHDFDERLKVLEQK